MCCKTIQLPFNVLFLRYFMNNSMKCIILVLPGGLISECEILIALQNGETWLYRETAPYISSQQNITLICI